MSFTITICWYSSSKIAERTISSPFWKYPLVRNWSDFATLSGVLRSPSLSVSSPSSLRISFTWTAISAVVSFSYMSSDLYAMSFEAIS